MEYYYISRYIYIDKFSLIKIIYRNKINIIYIYIFYIIFYIFVGENLIYNSNNNKICLYYFN